MCALCFAGRGLRTAAAWSMCSITGLDLDYKRFTDHIFFKRSRVLEAIIDVAVPVQDDSVS